MPRTINGENHRQSVRVPKRMIEDIDRIVKEYPGLNYNRQQLIESAIRDKIENLHLIKAKTQP